MGVGSFPFIMCRNRFLLRFLVGIFTAVIFFGGWFPEVKKSPNAFPEKISKERPAHPCLSKSGIFYENTDLDNFDPAEDRSRYSKIDYGESLLPESIRRDAQNPNFSNASFLSTVVILA